MKLRDNVEIQAEALRRIGFSASMDPSSLSPPNFERLMEQMSALKAGAGPYQNVVMCVDCSAVHDCPHDAAFENAFTHRRVCWRCGSRTGFRDVVGCWIPFSTWWKPFSWGRGCWAFEFCTSPDRLPDGTKRAAK